LLIYYRKLRCSRLRRKMHEGRRLCTLSRRGESFFQCFEVILTPLSFSYAKGQSVPSLKAAGP
jgi:hypothetical protein